MATPSDEYAASSRGTAPIPGGCRLVVAQRIEVGLDGVTLTVHAYGVALSEGEEGRIELLEAGPTARCRVLACDTLAGALGPPDTIHARFTVPAGPWRVVVDHAGGEETFSFESTVVCETCGTRNLSDRVFCASCGTNLTWASATAAAPPTRDRQARARSLGRPGAAQGDAQRPAPSISPEAAAPRADRSERSALQRVRDWTRGAWDTRTRRRSVGAEPGVPETTSSPSNAPAAGPPHPPDARGGRYPRMDAPPYAVVSEPVEVILGVRPSPDPDVGGGPMEVPPTTGETYILSVQLIADGFRQADGSTDWTWDLAVTPRQPYPAVTVKLIADPIDVPGKPIVLTTIYTVHDQVIGSGKRAIAIVRGSASAADVELPDVAVQRAMALPVGATAPDLTVVILADETVEGRLHWAFRTPHRAETPKRDCITTIGTTPEAFAELMRRSVERAEGKPMLLETMRGIGRMIADAVHRDFWRILDEVWDAAGTRPSLLFLSEEPYVPWELAVLRTSKFPDGTRFLAAEIVTGRWLLADGPTMPPPERVVVKGMAVVNGEYATARLRKLEEAKAETEALMATYGATRVAATLADVRRMLHGDPSAAILHFAIHGKFNSEGADLLMEDGEPLTVAAIRGSHLGNAPFVFLNACQVGSANELLGSYAGLAQAFISQGASAVVAPLWSVRDDVAKDLCLQFYPDVFGGERPAEVLRRVRASFGSGGDPESATVLAYQFYGHPAFMLTR